MRELISRGVVLLNGPMDRPWGIRTASFRDLGGHIGNREVAYGAVMHSGAWVDGVTPVRLVCISETLYGPKSDIVK